MKVIKLFLLLTLFSGEVAHAGGGNNFPVSIYVHNYQCTFEDGEPLSITVENYRVTRFIVDVWGFRYGGIQTSSVISEPNTLHWMTVNNTNVKAPYYSLSLDIDPNSDTLAFLSDFSVTLQAHKVDGRAPEVYHLDCSYIPNI